MSQLKISPCTGCGRPIVWATNTLTGKPIPLDPVAATYDIHVPVEGSQEAPVAIRANGKQMMDKPGTRLTLVSHFATCPKAHEFSQRNRT
jgi:hypothetical protein